MPNLFWKKSGKLVAIEEAPFASEDQLESYIIGPGQELLGDIFILKRQVQAGRDIPDLVGVDKDNNVVLIENKNREVTEEILPQILRYALWAETNPDSIRALWLEAKDKPDDIQMEWDKLEIRIIVLAPSIRLSVPRYVRKLNYKVDLIEVKRFLKNQEEFVLLNRLAEEPDFTRKPVGGLETYDRKFYEEWYNPNSVKRFFELVDELEKIVSRNKWKLERKFNKYYVGFKYGFPNAFGIHWVGSKSLECFLKLPKEQFKQAKRLIPYDSEYDDRWHQVTVRIADHTSLKKLVPALRKSYEYILGK